MASRPAPVQADPTPGLGEAITIGACQEPPGEPKSFEVPKFNVPFMRLSEGGDESRRAKPEEWG